MSTEVANSTGHWRRRVSGLALTGLLVVGVVGTVGACSARGGGGDSSASSDLAGPGAAQEPANPANPVNPVNPANPGDAGKSAGSAGSTGSGGSADGDAKAATEVSRTDAGQKLVRRADLQVKVSSLTSGAQKVRAIATQQRGAIVSEQLYAGETGRDTAGAITISVPATALDSTIALIEKIGEVQVRNSSSEDVTGTYVDTQARVTSMTASVARIRELLTRATTATDLVALENELSQRQAELDGLTAQLANLKDSVAMSPITVTLSTQDFEPAAAGFLSGLASGWTAFTTSVAVLVTVLGAILPFAVALALVLAPVLWWVRRRRSGTTGLIPAAPLSGGEVPPASAS